MSRLEGKKCPVCKQAFNPGDEVFYCDQCGIPHHKNCWRQNNGCATFRCPASAQPFSETAPKDVERGEGCYCILCGSFVPAGLQFCVKCGNKVEPPVKQTPGPNNLPPVPEQPVIKTPGSFCIACGSPIPVGQQQCASCSGSIEVFQTSTINAERNIPPMPSIVEVQASTEKPVVVKPTNEMETSQTVGVWQDVNSTREQSKSVISVAQKVIMLVLGLVIILLALVLVKNLLAKNSTDSQNLALQPEASNTDSPPLPTEAPTIAIAIPTRIPILTDDFSTNELGWPEINDDNFEIGLRDGRYRIFVADTSRAMYINPGYSFDNYQVEADVQKMDGPQDSHFGLLCRYTDADNYYYGAINSNQEYWISRMQGGRLTILGNGNIKTSSALNPGSSVNHLRLVCNGTNISLYANEVLLESVDDFTMASGDFSFYAKTSADAGGLEVAFDNLVVSEP